jgi:branched-chain amino acid transport system permease protein
MKVRRELLLIIILTIVAGLVPLGFGDDTFVMRIIILGLIYAVVGSAWDLIMGYAGVFTFGQIAFFGIGAYTTAILSTEYGVSPWLGVLAGGVMAGAVGVLIGLPCLRLKGSYVALLTFGVHMLFAAFVVSSLGVAIGTGGSGGILGIPPFSIGGYRLDALTLGPWLYLALGFFAVSMLIIYKVIFSHTGTAFIALRDNEQLAQSVGVSSYRYKLLVFAISAVLTGSIGAYYAHYTGFVSGRMLGLDMFIMLMVMQVAGGLGIFPGTAIAAFPVLLLNEYLRVADVYRPIVFGAMVLLLVLFLPRGLLGTLGGGSDGLTSLGRIDGLRRAVRRPRGAPKTDVEQPSPDTRPEPEP